MSDAWIYGEHGSEVTSQLLAELGYSPHRVAANSTLRPPAGDNRAPALAVVLATGLERPTCEELCARLAADQDLGEVPVHLRDSHYRGAAALGHGQGYHYPHDDPRGWVDQEYRPPETAERRYYEPTAHGHEQEIRDRMATREPGQNTDESGES